MKRPEPIARLFSAPGSPLKGYQAIQQRAERLKRLLNRQLPEELHQSYSLGALHGRGLTLYAHDAMWATRLRYFSESLLAALKREPEYKTIQSVKIKLLPPTENVRHVSHPHYSVNGASQLRNGAEKLEEGELRNALLRLAEHLRNKPKG